MALQNRVFKFDQDEFNLAKSLYCEFLTSNPTLSAEEFCDHLIAQASVAPPTEKKLLDYHVAILQCYWFLLDSTMPQHQTQELVIELGRIDTNRPDFYDAVKKCLSTEMKCFEEIQIRQIEERCLNHEEYIKQAQLAVIDVYKANCIGKTQYDIIRGSVSVAGTKIRSMNELRESLARIGLQNPVVVAYLLEFLNQHTLINPLNFFKLTLMQAGIYPLSLKTEDLLATTNVEMDRDGSLLLSLYSPLPILAAEPGKASELPRPMHAYGLVKKRISFQPSALVLDPLKPYRDIRVDVLDASFDIFDAPSRETYVRFKLDEIFNKIRACSLLTENNRVALSAFLSEFGQSRSVEEVKKLVLEKKLDSKLLYLLAWYDRGFATTIVGDAFLLSEMCKHPVSSQDPRQSKMIEILRLQYSDDIWIAQRLDNVLLSQCEIVGDSVYQVTKKLNSAKKRDSTQAALTAMTDFNLRSFGKSKLFQKKITALTKSDWLIGSLSPEILTDYSIRNEPLALRILLPGWMQFIKILIGYYFFRLKNVNQPLSQLNNAQLRDIIIAHPQKWARIFKRRGWLKRFLSFSSNIIDQLNAIDIAAILEKLPVKERLLVWEFVRNDAKLREKLLSLEEQSPKVLLNVLGLCHVTTDESSYQLNALAAGDYITKLFQHHGIERKDKVSYFKNLILHQASTDHPVELSRQLDSLSTSLLTSQALHDRVIQIVTLQSPDAIPLIIALKDNDLSKMDYLQYAKEIALAHLRDKEIAKLLLSTSRNLRIPSIDQMKEACVSWMAENTQDKLGILKKVLDDAEYGQSVFVWLFNNPIIFDSALSHEKFPAWLSTINNLNLKKLLWTVAKERYLRKSVERNLGYNISPVKLSIKTLGAAQNILLTSEESQFVFDVMLRDKENFQLLDNMRDILSAKHSNRNLTDSASHIYDSPTLQQHFYNITPLQLRRLWCMIARDKVLPESLLNYVLKNPVLAQKLQEGITPIQRFVLVKAYPKSAKVLLSDQAYVDSAFQLAPCAFAEESIDIQNSSPQYSYYHQVFEQEQWRRLQMQGQFIAEVEAIKNYADVSVAIGTIKRLSETHPALILLLMSDRFFIEKLIKELSNEEGSLFSVISSLKKVPDATRNFVNCFLMYIIAKPIRHEPLNNQSIISEIFRNADTTLIADYIATYPGNKTFSDELSKVYSERIIDISNDNERETLISTYKAVFTDKMPNLLKNYFMLLARRAPQFNAVLRREWQKKLLSYIDDLSFHPQDFIDLLLDEYSGSFTLGEDHPLRGYLLNGHFRREIFTKSCIGKQLVKLVIAEVGYSLRNGGVAEIDRSVILKDLCESPLAEYIVECATVDELHLLALSEPRYTAIISRYLLKHHALHDEFLKNGYKLANALVISLTDQELLISILEMFKKDVPKILGDMPLAHEFIINRLKNATVNQRARFFLLETPLINLEILSKDDGVSMLFSEELSPDIQARVLIQLLKLSNQFPTELTEVIKANIRRSLEQYLQSAAFNALLLHATQDQLWTLFSAAQGNSPACQLLRNQLFSAPNEFVIKRILLNSSPNQIMELIRIAEKYSPIQNKLQSVFLRMITRDLSKNITEARSSSAWMRKIGDSREMLGFLLSRINGHQLAGLLDTMISKEIITCLVHHPEYLVNIFNGTEGVNSLKAFSPLFIKLDNLLLGSESLETPQMQALRCTLLHSYSTILFNTQNIMPKPVVRHLLTNFRLITDPEGNYAFVDRSNHPMAPPELYIVAMMQVNHPLIEKLPLAQDKFREFVLKTCTRCGNRLLFKSGTPVPRHYHQMLKHLAGDSSGYQNCQREYLQEMPRSEFSHLLSSR